MRRVSLSDLLCGRARKISWKFELNIYSIKITVKLNHVKNINGAKRTDETKSDKYAYQYRVECGHEFKYSFEKTTRINTESTELMRDPQRETLPDCVVTDKRWWGVSG